MAFTSPPTDRLGEGWEKVRMQTEVIMSLVRDVNCGMKGEGIFHLQWVQNLT